MEKFKFDELLKINGQELTKKYIQSLSKQERLDLIDPIFLILRNQGFTFPDNNSKLKLSYKKICEFKPDITINEIFNNSSLGTDISKFFCSKSFFSTTEYKKQNMIEIYNDDILLKKISHNRLGLDWLDDDEKGPGINEAFNLRTKMFIQAMRSMRLIIQTSVFKPTAAKYLTEKYSNENDHIYDYSAGFGARMLGTISANRQYTGVDPLTIPELIKMKDFLNIKATLINDMSENVKLKENSFDLSFSSPPYYNQEVYSNDQSQAYNKGEDYFYNIYWRKTLENIKYMLKPNKYFILNVSNYPKMIDIAKEYFIFDHEIYLRTIRSHLTKSKGITKYEPIYVFKNNK